MVTYADADYANSRLSETVVLNKRTTKLFYVRYVSSMSSVNGYEVDTSEDRIVRLADLDLMPLPLGYTNTSHGAFYLTRTPCRRFKQGSNWSNLRLVGYPGRASRSSYKLLLQPVFCNYPSIEEALSLCEDTIASVAISRNFCVSANGLLMYKGHVKTPVGRVNLDNAQIKLDQDYSYLNDVFDLEVPV